MQDAVPQGQGAMAAILGLDDQAVSAACAEAANGEVCEAVNFNAPSQVVIAGHAGAVARAMEAAKARGEKRAVPLAVIAPFHSSLMAPAAARLGDALAKIAVSVPRIPVIHNVDARSRDNPEGIRKALVTQADHPVRWVECIKEMAARGVTHVFECGPARSSRRSWAHSRRPGPGARRSRGRWNGRSSREDGDGSPGTGQPVTAARADSKPDRASAGRARRRVGTATTRPAQSIGDCNLAPGVQGGAGST
jgi:acyl transferase domain-containing protein